MPDYYIRTPDHEESRGPFDPSKLQTLAEAGQVTQNTLYYDEDKEEWMPIALNPELKRQVFPEREKLSLRSKTAEGEQKNASGEATAAGDSAPAEPAEPVEKGGLSVEAMLAAAEGETDETRHLKKKEKSFQKAAALATSGIGLMMLFSALVLLMPHFSVVGQMYEESAATRVINYPFLLIGLFDLIMAGLLFLAVTEVYPLLRARAMLTLGFGIYLGWALGDPILLPVATAAGIGIFLATIAKSYLTMLLALFLGVGGNGYLAYLAIIGRFSGFFEAVQFDIISGQ